jgi:hypothetical protein
MHLIIHSDDHPITKKYGSALTKRDLQVLFCRMLYSSQIKNVTYCCGGRSVLIKSHLETVCDPSSEEYVEVIKKYPK